MHSYNNSPVPVVQDNVWKPDPVAGNPDGADAAIAGAVPAQPLVVPLLVYSIASCYHGDDDDDDDDDDLDDDDDDDDAIAGAVPAQPLVLPLLV